MYQICEAWISRQLDQVYQRHWVSLTKIHLNSLKYGCVIFRLASDHTLSGLIYLVGVFKSFLNKKLLFLQKLCNERIF